MTANPTRIAMSKTLHDLTTLMHSRHVRRIPIVDGEDKVRGTVLFSNTARAHQLGKTHDWVVLYYDGGQGERQCTVITSQRGPLTGKRIVRGREGECVSYYMLAMMKSHGALP